MNRQTIFKYLLGIGLPVLLGVALISGLALSMRYAAAVTETTFTVNSTIDASDSLPGDGICETGLGNGICTLRAAIEEANALSGNDTILVPAGIITLSNGTLSVLTDMSITGVGQEDTVVRGAVNPSGSGNFYITGTVMIANMTIRDGQSFSGGGVTNAGNLALQNVAVFSNTAPYGGGILNSGTLTVRDSFVEGNSGSYGAGIQNTGGSVLFISSSTISGNVATDTGSGLWGGGILIYGTATISNSSVISNSVIGGTGGGIVLGDISTNVLTITNVTISGNSVAGTNSSGGGLAVFGGNLTVNNSTFVNNEAVSDSSGGRNGGAFYGVGGNVFVTGSTFNNNRAENGAAFLVESGLALVIEGSTFSDNNAFFSGGAIFNNGTVTMTNTTFYDNAASATIGFRGGAFYNAGTAVLKNSTIAGNSAPDGGGVFVSSGTLSLANVILADNSPNNCLGTITSLGHNLDSGNSCNLTTTGDMINANPLLGPLVDNGGATLTMALLPGSPAIDAGSNANCPFTDQRGVMRPQDGDVDGTAVCDIGAYEFVVRLLLPVIIRNP